MMIYKIFELIKFLGGKLNRGSKALMNFFFDNADSILKLAGSLAIVSGAILVHSYESKLSAVTLISEREQAESQLRASMFSNLITPISGPSKEKEIDPHRERVLVELLALNFHEHFEFKPLMLHVDKRLSKACDPNHDCKKMITKEQAEEDRASLRSIARRITSKQINTLIKEKLPYPMEMLRFEVPIAKITDVKRLDNKTGVKSLNNKLVENKVVLKDSNDFLYFYHKNENELEKVLKEKFFTEPEIVFVLDKSRKSFIKQHPIEIKRKNFTNERLIYKLIEEKIVVEKNVDEENYLLFYYETSEELTNKLMLKDFTDADIDSVLYNLQISLKKHDPIEVKRKIFTNERLIKKLIKKGIVVEKNVDEENGVKVDYLLFNHESENKLYERLKKKGFKEEERFDVLSRYSISLTKCLDGIFTLKIPGDENNRYLRVGLKDIDSYNETVEVHFAIVYDYGEDDVGTDDTFTLTWYDFPFTDYTILSNGIRFSLILYKMELVKKDIKSHYAVYFKIIWFPKDFFTAHERPINYKVFRKYLGISD